MCIPFNSTTPHLAIKPKEMIKNVYKDLSKIMFIKMLFIRGQLDCPSFLPTDKGGREQDGGPGTQRRKLHRMPPKDDCIRKQSSARLGGLEVPFQQNKV